MNRNTKILLNGILIGAVITQLLNMTYFRHSFTIGGEILLPVLVLLIRQVIVKIADIFTEIRNEITNEIRRKSK